jgi:aspartyl protease family protein
MHSQLLLLIALLFSTGTVADHKIYYSSYLSGKANIQINGRSRALSPGQTSNEGVKLLSFNKKEAIVRVHGKRYRYKRKSKDGVELEDEVSIPFTEFNGGGGGYYVLGFINGKQVPFIVDTGATHVVINLKDARKLKIGFNKKDKGTVGLAGGKTADAWSTVLKSVRVADIEIKKVPAVIIDSRENSIALLGMSFLKELDISQSKNKMILKYTAP